MSLLTAVLLFHLADARIDEASGIARGITNPAVVYVQNDSGDSARFFAVDGRTGATRAVYAVPGATNVDWEDIAVARDARGVSSVWLGDIGDNGARRAEIRVYRVDEPPRAGPTEVWRLRYPDGPHDAESLAVAPGGAAYIVTKSAFGSSAVYALPGRPDPDRLQLLRRVGELTFSFTGTPGGPNSVGQLTATGAGFSHDGSVLAIRTYTDAYVWRVPHGDVAAALRARPVRVALPAQPQGEGIAVDGDRLLLDSEGAHSAVYAVPLPALPAASTAASASASSPLAPHPTATAADDTDRDPFPIGWSAAALAAAALLVLGLRRIVRRRR